MPCAQRLRPLQRLQRLPCQWDRVKGPLRRGRRPRGQGPLFPGRTARLLQGSVAGGLQGARMRAPSELLRAVRWTQSLCHTLRGRSHSVGTTDLHHARQARGLGPLGLGCLLCQRSAPLGAQKHQRGPVESRLADPRELGGQLPAYFCCNIHPRKGLGYRPESFPCGLFPPRVC